MARTVGFATTLTMLFAALPLLAQEKPILAVMEIEDKTGKFTDTQIQEAATYLRSKLEVAGTFMVVAKSRQEKALIRELRKDSYKDCYAEQCQIELGKELAADTILKSRVTKFAGTCTLSSALISLGGAAAVGGASADFDCTEMGLRSALDSVLTTVTGEKDSKSTERPWRVAEGKIGETSQDRPQDTTHYALVKVTSDPSGATVRADGVLLCKETPCTKQLSLGNHELSMESEGNRYLPRKENVTIERGSSITWELTPNFGLLTVHSEPSGLDVKLDSNVVGKTPLEKKEVSIGGHEVLVTSECHYDSGEAVNIERGEHRTLEVRVKERQAPVDVFAEDQKGNAVEATVFADGKKVGTTAQTVNISICARELKVEKPGYSSCKPDAKLAENRRTKLRCVLKAGEKSSGNEPSEFFPGHSPEWEGLRERIPDLEITERFDWWRFDNLPENDLLSFSGHGVFAGYGWGLMRLGGGFWMVAPAFRPGTSEESIGFLLPSFRASVRFADGGFWSRSSVSASSRLFFGLALPSDSESDFETLFFDTVVNYRFRCLGWLTLQVGLAHMKGELSSYENVFDENGKIHQEKSGEWDFHSMYSLVGTELTVFSWGSEPTLAVRVLTQFRYSVVGTGGLMATASLGLSLLDAW